MVACTVKWPLICGVVGNLLVCYFCFQHMIFYSPGCSQVPVPPDFTSQMLDYRCFLPHLARIFSLFRPVPFPRFLSSLFFQGLEPSSSYTLNICWILARFSIFSGSSRFNFTQGIPWPSD